MTEAAPAYDPNKDVDSMDIDSVELELETVRQSREHAVEAGDMTEDDKLMRRQTRLGARLKELQG